MCALVCIILLDIYKKCPGLYNPINDTSHRLPSLVTNGCQELVPKDIREEVEKYAKVS